MNRSLFFLRHPASSSIPQAVTKGQTYMGDLIEIEPGTFTDRVTNAELIEVLGLEDRAELDELGDTIKTCAGEWKRADSVFWTLKSDPEFDA